MFCLLLLASYKGNTQSLASQLTGGDSRAWELRSCDLEGADDWTWEEFGDHDEFEEDSDLAQLLPETIVFHNNGTCEMLYVSYYMESDDTPYDNFTDEDLTVKGRWSVSGNTVTITEDNGWTWSLKDINIRPDEDGSDFECIPVFAGATHDINSVVYDWWPADDGDDGEDGGEEEEEEDDDDGGGMPK